MPQTLLNEIIEELDGDDLYSIVLFGSYSSNEAGIFSDVDISCFLKSEQHSHPFRKIFLKQKKLITVDYITPRQFPARLSFPAWESLKPPKINYLKTLRNSRFALEKI